MHCHAVQRKPSEIDLKNFTDVNLRLYAIVYNCAKRTDQPFA